jgi:hypothetical protein
MRIDEKRVDGTLPYIDLDDADEQSITRSEYEELAAFEARLSAQADATEVVISVRLLGRLLQSLAVELVHGKL